jgi:hypothetical protein
MLKKIAGGSAMFPGATGNASDEPGNPVLSNHHRRGEVLGEINGEGFIRENHPADNAFRERLARAGAELAGARGERRLRSTTSCGVLISVRQAPRTMRPLDAPACRRGTTSSAAFILI